MRKERHLSQAAAAAAHICNYKFCKHESTIRQEEKKKTQHFEGFESIHQQLFHCSCLLSKFSSFPTHKYQIQP